MVGDRERTGEEGKGSGFDHTQHTYAHVKFPSNREGKPNKQAKEVLTNRCTKDPDARGSMKDFEMPVMFMLIKSTEYNIRRGGQIAGND